MADQQKVMYGLSNGAIFNDLEQPPFLTLHISETVRDTDIVTTK